jgi:hypothetical protein
LAATRGSRDQQDAPPGKTVWIELSGDSAAVTDWLRLGAQGSRKAARPAALAFRTGWTISG